VGTTPADTEREITRLRGDMTAALEELERRLRGGVRGVASAEARITSGRAREEAIGRVRENASLAGVGAVVVAGAIAYGVYSVVAGQRERARPTNRLRRQAERVRGEVGERVEASRQQLQRARDRGVLVKLEPASSGYMRLTDARLELLKPKRGQSTVIKKLVWAAMLSIFMALGSVIARRVAGQVWRATVREDPPTEKSKAES
jgi:hypothetical protein